MDTQSLFQLRISGTSRHPSTIGFPRITRPIWCHLQSSSNSQPLMSLGSQSHSCPTSFTLEPVVGGRHLFSCSFILLVFLRFKPPNLVVASPGLQSNCVTSIPKVRRKGYLQGQDETWSWHRPHSNGFLHHPWNIALPQLLPFSKGFEIGTG